MKEDLIEKTRQYVSTEKYENNLTETENKGLKSLQDKENIVIFQTDKSGRFSVDSKANYREACEEHIKEDVNINEKEHMKAQSQINAHSIMWTNITKAGEGCRSKERVKNNLLVENSGLAPVYALRKDHKVCNDQEKGPPTRPVCGASSGYNNKLSNFISTIIRPIWKDNEIVCTNTEEMMAAIESTNKSNKSSDIIVGSADVKALYPSLDIDSCAEIVSRTFEESEVEVRGVDPEEIGLYLALNMEEEELKEKGIAQFCPTRKSKVGARPTITGCAMSKDYEKRMKPWNERKEEPNDAETKKLLAEALRIVILFIMKNHIYQFDNQIKRQKDGGPIGLELTGDLAQIFMIWYDNRLLDRLREENITVLMYKRYVDDINMVVQKSNQDDNEKTIMEKVREIGNTIHSNIEIEVDYPEKHEDKKMPLLDLKVWVEGKRVMHEFYHKTVSSKAMIHRRTAMPTSKKRTIITQEILRVMTRCSPNLEWRDVIPHLNEAMKRVQYSGYNKQFRCEVLKSAINAYKKIKEKDRNGTQPMYRKRDWRKEEREKEKKKKRTGWFRKGGKRSVIFIPATPKSKLKKLYEDAIRKSELPISVVERSGITLKNKLQKSDPLGKAKKCHNKEECMICMNGGKSCRKEGITYEIECEECGDKYIGESARNGYTRGREHLNEYKNKSKNSVLLRHAGEKHDDTSRNTTYKMRITGIYKGDPTLRQVTESVKIQNSRNIINNKCEWNAGGLIGMHIVRT